MVVTPELLNFFPLLKLLPASSLASLAQAATVEKFARRAVVLNAGQHEQRICFLFEGRLQGVDFTVDGREVGLFFVEPGDFCGELALFDKGPQPEYIIVLSPAVVVWVPLETLRELMLACPPLVNFLGDRLARRIRQLLHQRSLLGMPNIAQRVCSQLWLLVEEIDKAHMKGGTIRNPPTHMEIAIMLNLSRETVTRVFQSLQQQDVVQRDGASRLQIPSLSLLKGYADGSREL
ncbi:MAG TPA: Crp/Fnr family transcriptional regulator [Candidatus Acidoferrum sp.]|nr:Crp/Fnr family transcriptional regulator [Candidatus Acidoferrum sp.]